MTAPEDPPYTSAQTALVRTSPEVSRTDWMPVPETFRTNLDDEANGAHGHLARGKLHPKCRGDRLRLKYAVSEERLISNPLDDPKLNWERPSDMEVDHLATPCIPSSDISTFLRPDDFTGTL